MAKTISVVARACGCSEPLAEVTRLDYDMVRLQMNHFPMLEAPDGPAFQLSFREAEDLGNALLESACAEKEECTHERED